MYKNIKYKLIVCLLFFFINKVFTEVKSAEETFFIEVEDEKLVLIQLVDETVFIEQKNNDNNLNFEDTVNIIKSKCHLANGVEIYDLQDNSEIYKYIYLYCNNLKTIDLFNVLSKDSEIIIKIIEKNQTSLEKVIFLGVGERVDYVNDQTIDVIAKLKNLKRLYLSLGSYSDEGLINFFNQIDLTKLEGFKIYDVSYVDERKDIITVKSIKKISKMVNVKELALGYEFGGVDDKVLAEIICSLKKLTYLRISHLEVGDNTFECIKKLKDLEYLNFYKVNIGVNIKRFIELRNAISNTFIDITQHLYSVKEYMQNEKKFEYRRGIRLFKDKQYELAIKSLKKSIHYAGGEDEYKGDYDLYLRLAFSYEALGKYKDALYYLEKIPKKTNELIKKINELKKKLKPN